LNEAREGTYIDGKQYFDGFKELLLYVEEEGGNITDGASIFQLLLHLCVADLVIRETSYCGFFKRIWITSSIIVNEVFINLSTSQM